MELKDTLNAGDEIIIQVAPFGEYPANTVEGEPITQRFDKESFEKVIEDWKNQGAKMVRCDYDHNSEMTDDTIASGWINDLWIDDEKGLMGKLVVTESGAKSLNGLDYRYGSPVFVFDETEHPVSLLSFAFTNRPRLDKMDAVYNMNEKNKAVVVNSNSNEEEISDNGENKETPIEENQEKPDEVEESNKETETEMVNNIEEKVMDELKQILGLPPEATDEDIKASVKEMVDKLKAIADEEIAEEAVEAVNECGIEDEKKEEVINAYKQNPSLVKSVLNCMKKQPVKMVVNADEAQKPDLTDNEKLKREYATLKGGKDKVDFLLAHPGIKL